MLVEQVGFARYSDGVPTDGWEFRWYRGNVNFRPERVAQGVFSLKESYYGKRVTKGLRAAAG